MRAANRALLGILCAALSACTTLTPDYRRPDGAVINQPSAQGAFASHAAVVDTPAIDQWWILYGDSKLNELVGRALAANTDVRVATANLARAQSGLQVARDARMPQVGVQAGPGFGRSSAEEKVAQGPLDSGYIYSVDASVSYQVDLFGQVRRAIESATANSDAAQAAVAATRMTIAAQTVQSYIAACSAGRELAVARRSIELQRQASQLARRRFEAGRASSLDVTRSLTQEERIGAAIPVFESRRQEQLYRLAVLTGATPSDFPRDLAECAQEPALAQPIPTGNGAELLARRPDVVFAEAQLRAATADLGVATANLYPRVQLGLSGGSVGRAINFLSEDTLKFSIGPLISWQMPNRARAKAQVAAAQASIDAAYARFDGTVLAALKEVESALTIYQRDIERMIRLRAAQENASKSSRDARRLFAEGRDSFFSVLDADQKLVAVEQELAVQQSTLAGDQVQLFLTLGGGWQASAPPNPQYNSIN